MGEYEKKCAKKHSLIRPTGTSSDLAENPKSTEQAVASIGLATQCF